MHTCAFTNYSNHSIQINSKRMQKCTVNEYRSILIENPVSMPWGSDLNGCTFRKQRMACIKVIISYNTNSVTHFNECPLTSKCKMTMAQNDNTAVKILDDITVKNKVIPEQQKSLDKKTGRGLQCWGSVERASEEPLGMNLFSLYSTVLPFLIYIPQSRYHVFTHQPVWQWHTTTDTQSTAK